MSDARIVSCAFGIHAAASETVVFWFHNDDVDDEGAAAVDVSGGGQWRERREGVGCVKHCHNSRFFYILIILSLLYSCLLFAGDSSSPSNASFALA